MLAFCFGCTCDSDFKYRYIESVLYFFAEDLKSFDLVNVQELRSQTSKLNYTPKELAFLAFVYEWIHTRLK